MRQAVFVAMLVTVIAVSASVSASALLKLDSVSAEISQLEVVCDSDNSALRVVLWGPRAAQDLPASAPTDGSSKTLAQMQIQTWLLRQDGTAVTQLRVRDLMALTALVPGMPNSNVRSFSFMSVPCDEISALVVSADGVLRVWPVGKASK